MYDFTISLNTRSFSVTLAEGKFHFFKKIFGDDQNVNSQHYISRV